jgi:hypothetical protein
MATFTKQLLSGSTNGKGILVSGTTSGAAVTVHTAVTGTSSIDEIWIYAHNTSATAVKLTVEWGETTAPNGNIEVNIGAEGTGMILVSPGIVLNNSLVVKAFAGTANVINLFGYANRIS